MKIKNVLLTMTVLMLSTIVSFGNSNRLHKIDYSIEIEKGLSLECWMISDTVWVTDVKKEQKELKKYQGEKIGNKPRKGSPEKYKFEGNHSKMKKHNKECEKCPNYKGKDFRGKHGFKRGGNEYVKSFDNKNFIDHKHRLE